MNEKFKLSAPKEMHGNRIFEARSLPNIEVSCATHESLGDHDDANLSLSKPCPVSALSSSVERLVEVTRRLTACHQACSALEQRKSTAGLIETKELLEATTDGFFGMEQESLCHQNNKTELVSFQRRGTESSEGTSFSPDDAAKEDNNIRFIGHLDLSPKSANSGSPCSMELQPPSPNTSTRKWARLLGISPDDIGNEAEFIQKSAIKPLQITSHSTAGHDSLKDSWNAALDGAQFGSLDSVDVTGHPLHRSSSWKDKMSLPFFSKRFTQVKTLQQDELIRMIASGKPSYEQVHMWRKSFEALLGDKYGLALFKEFLATEFSDENIEFWIACEDYKKISQSKKQQALAQRIYDDFVATQSRREVNLDSVTRDQTVTELSNPSSRTFENAQKRIQALMERDSYGRFLRSDLYATLITEAKKAARALAAAAREQADADYGVDEDSSSTPGSAPEASGMATRFRFAQFRPFGGSSAHKGVGTALPGVLAAAADAEAGMNSVQDLQLLGLSTSRHMQQRINAPGGPGTASSVSQGSKRNTGTSPNAPTIKKPHESRSPHREPPT